MDSALLSECIRKYHGTVYRAAYSYLGNHADAEDIVQDTFVKLLSHGGGFESDEHMKAWLIRVAVNLSKNLLKSCRYTRQTELDDSIPCESGEEHSLLQAVMALPPKYRTAIYLHYYEGYSAREIAAITGSTVSAVTTRLARGRERLKKTLLEGQL